MIKVPIRGKRNASIVTVDDDMADKVSQYKWHILPNGYVETCRYTKGSGRKNQKNKHLYLHRLVMDAGKGQYVDHVNRNPLDNRKCNLRFCTQSQNGANTKIPKNNTTGHRGVYWDKINKNWIAAIHYLGRKIHLGCFADKKDAISKRESASIYYFKEFGGQ